MIFVIYRQNLQQQITTKINNAVAGDFTTKIYEQLRIIYTELEHHNFLSKFMFTNKNIAKAISLHPQFHSLRTHEGFRQLLVDAIKNSNLDLNQALYEIASNTTIEMHYAEIINLLIDAGANNIQECCDVCAMELSFVLNNPIGAPQRSISNEIYEIFSNISHKQKQ
jgi:hypothetical protein